MTIYLFLVVLATVTLVVLATVTFTGASSPRRHFLRYANHSLDERGDVSSRSAAAVMV